MKIGFVLDDGLDVPDGVQQYVLTLGRWYVEQGHQVHYLVGQTTRDDIENVHSLSSNLPVTFNGNKLSIPLHAPVKNIRNILAEQRFDVLHVQMPYSPLLAGKIVANAPPMSAVVGTFHILPYGRLQTLGSRLLAQTVRKTLARFDAIVAVSTAAQQFAEQAMNITTTVVPNAVNLKGFTKGKKFKKYDDGKQNVVFLGRLVERKGCMQFLQAIRLLQAEDKLQNVRVIVAGHGPDRERLEQYITANNLESVVEMAGWITEADKPHYLRSADVAVMPSIAGESFGIVLVEAIASGAGVVLGGDNPGYRYVLDDQPLALINPHDTQEFASRIHKLLTDASLRKKIHQTQVARIADFDVAIVGAKLLTIYKREIAKRRQLGNNG